ncbi:MAG: DUF2344 domain-containing protein [Oscillospiraceae bacterium]|nr:DUF2344 domain-containing protein [Oscillospiraceae bacterium]
MPRLVFEKTGDSVWISHLDTMRVFQRAFRRAGVMLKHSQGFTPRAIVSIALPLSVGVESRCELLDYELEQEATLTADMLNAVLPEGMRVLSIVENGRKIKELTHLRAHLTLTYDHGITDEQLQQLQALYHRESLVLEKHSRKGKTETDILPMLCEMTMEKKDNTTVGMDVLVCAQNPSLNPQLLINAIEIYAPELMPDAVKIRRMEVYDTEGQVFR